MAKYRGVTRKKKKAQADAKKEREGLASLRWESGEIEYSPKRFQQLHAYLKKRHVKDGLPPERVRRNALSLLAAHRSALSAIAERCEQKKHALADTLINLEREHQDAQKRFQRGRTYAASVDKLVMPRSEPHEASTFAQLWGAIDELATYETAIRRFDALALGESPGTSRSETTNAWYEIRPGDAELRELCVSLSAVLSDFLRHWQRAIRNSDFRESIPESVRGSVIAHCELILKMMECEQIEPSFLKKAQAHLRQIGGAARTVGLAVVTAAAAAGTTYAITNALDTKDAEESRIELAAISTLAENSDECMTQMRALILERLETQKPRSD